MNENYPNQDPNFPQNQGFNQYPNQYPPQQPYYPPQQPYYPAPQQPYYPPQAEPVFQPVQDMPPQENANPPKKKGGKFFAAVAIICVLALVITGVFNVTHNKPYGVTTSYQTGDSSAEIKDAVKVLENSKQLEKGVEDLSYNNEKNEYTLKYKSLPEEFKSLEKGDIFVVPTNENAKNYAFNVGFSGKVTDISDTSLIFSIPNFKDLFKKFKIDAGKASAENVIFVPENGVEIEEFITGGSGNVNTASIGLNSAKTEKISIGDFTGETVYQKTNEVSKLEGYDLVAKKLSLKISKTSKIDDTEKIDVSGKVTLNYPAVKFNMDYNGQNDDIKSYDVGLITNQSVSLSIKGTSELGLDDVVYDVKKNGIIDIKDTSDLESGKVVLGSFYVGYYLPILYNQKNLTPIIGVCLVFQVCLTANGKIELECTASESGYLRVEANSNGKNICEIKNSKYPNPVLGETAVEGMNYDDIAMKSSVKGTLDFTAALSVDVGFSILGTIPIKIANDVMNFEAVTSFENEEEENKKTDIVENLVPKDLNNVSYYRFKSQSVLRFMIGGALKVAGVKVDAGSIGYSKTLYNKVWYQYPKPVKFSKKECDFGGIQLGDKYTEEELSAAYYKKKQELGKSSLSGKVKDDFLKKATQTLSDKINFELDDLSDLVPVSGESDVVCFSDGVIYFLEDGVVKAELVTGDNVYNRSFLSRASSGKFVKKVYSEPKNEETIKIQIGEIGAYLLEQIGGEGLKKYDGTNLTYYNYEAKGAHMDVYLNGDDIIFIVAYQ